MPNTNSPDTLCLPSPAKLNLFLHIVGQRADGYHELQTLFQFLDYSDQITFKRLDANELRLETESVELASNDNLILQAARLLREHTQSEQGAYIFLEKRLPMGGGVGGGSSNAATTLLALNLLWQLGLSIDELATLGLSLGADVPVFVRGHAAFAQGVGEKLTQVEVDQPWYLVVHPGCHVSTPAVFKHAELPRNHVSMSWQQLKSKDFWQNDCENLVRKMYPQVDKALLWLLEYAPSKMTGTGSCVFARFEDESKARDALDHLPQGMTGFVARGLNQSPLHKQLDLTLN